MKYFLSLCLKICEMIASRFQERILYLALLTLQDLKMGQIAYRFQHSRHNEWILSKFFHQNLIQFHHQGKLLLLVRQILYDRIFLYLQLDHPRNSIRSNTLSACDLCKSINQRETPWLRLKTHSIPFSAF